MVSLNLWSTVLSSRVGHICAFTLDYIKFRLSQLRRVLVCQDVIGKPNLLNKPILVQ